jgi:hypothetical protein
MPRVVRDLPVSRKKKDIFQGVDEEEEKQEIEKPKPVMRLSLTNTCHETARAAARNR